MCDFTIPEQSAHSGERGSQAREYPVVRTASQSTEVLRLIGWPPKLRKHSFAQ